VDGLFDNNRHVKQCQQDPQDHKVYKESKELRVTKEFRDPQDYKDHKEYRDLV